MPRVVPSQVVEFIATIPHARQDLVRMNNLGRPVLSSTLALAEQVPDELLTMDAAAYGLFVYAKEQLREILTVWNANQTAGQKLQEFSFGAPTNPLNRLRDTLAKCPDESPARGTSELNFITDSDFRTELRNDVGRVNTALANGEWKAATVLAGSVIESLLLWALQQRLPSDIAKAKASATGTKLPKQPLDEWHLPDYIEATHILKIITDDTATQARLAKDFRNLIHPGRSQRLAQECDRATALSAVAGMEHVVRDLV